MWRQSTWGGNDWTLTLKLYREASGEKSASFSFRYCMGGGFINWARSKDSLTCCRLNRVTVCSRADQTCDWYTQCYSCITPACRRSTAGLMTAETGLGTVNVSKLVLISSTEFGALYEKEQCPSKTAAGAAACVVCVQEADSNRPNVYRCVHVKVEKIVHDADLSVSSVALRVVKRFREHEMPSPSCPTASTC